MGALEFWSSLINSLAWPAAAVAIVLMLRSAISSMLTRGTIKRLKAGPGGLDVEYFEKTVSEARAEIVEDTVKAARPGGVEAMPAPESPDAPSSIADFSDEMERLAEVSPSAVVLESFRRLEGLLQRMVVPKLEAPPRAGYWANVRALAREASSRGILSEAEADVLREVTNLRNAVSHDRSYAIGREQALQYAELIKQLAIAILTSQGRTVLDADQF